MSVVGSRVALAKQKRVTLVRLVLLAISVALGIGCSGVQRNYIRPAGNGTRVAVTGQSPPSDADAMRTYADLIATKMGVRYIAR
jgi:hypothetical protein